MSAPRSVASWRWSAPALVAGTGLLGAFVTIGADWDWLVAAGDHVRRTSSLPDTVPFAAADSTGWRNVPLLGELVASGLRALGPRVPVLAHLLAVAVALAVLAVTARRRGASDGAVAGGLALVVLGSLAALGVVRAQSYSYVPFALLVALLVDQQRRSDRRIWWAVPLVAVWGNLHGAVLLGTCVLGAHLVVGRLRHRPAETVTVGAASLLAVCATPEGWHTPAYYLSVLDNVSAQRGEGLWARPSPSQPFDVLMLLACAALLVAVLRRRRPLWEYVAVAGLCLATASAARHGVWLAFLLLALLGRDPAEEDGPGGGGGPTTTGVPSRRDRPGAAVRAWLPALLAVLAAGLVASTVALGRGEAVLGAAPTALVDEVAAVAGDRVVLAPGALAEALAVDGVRVWVSNPVDAFDHRDQAAYLDFLAGEEGGTSAIRSAELVVTREGTPSDELAARTEGLSEVGCAPGWSCRVVG